MKSAILTMVQTDNWFRLFSGLHCKAYPSNMCIHGRKFKIYKMLNFRNSKLKLAGCLQKQII